MTKYDFKPGDPVCFQQGATVETQRWTNGVIRKMEQSADGSPVYMIEETIVDPSYPRPWLMTWRVPVDRPSLQRLVPEESQLRSSRGHLLFGRPSQHAFITCEIYSKWYELFIVHPDGNIVSLSYGSMADSLLHTGTLKHTTVYVDHCPNPTAVRAYADTNALEIDELAFDMIAGRWANEVKS